MKYQQYFDKPMDIPMDISSNKNAVHRISSIHPNLKFSCRSESVPKDWDNFIETINPICDRFGVASKNIAKTPVRGVLQFGLPSGYLT
jgi:hypothetical protein